MMGGGGGGWITTYTPRRKPGLLHLDRIEKWADYARTDVLIGDGDALGESYRMVVRSLDELGRSIDKLEASGRL